MFPTEFGAGTGDQDRPQTMQPSALIRRSNETLLLFLYYPQISAVLDLFESLGK